MLFRGIILFFISLSLVACMTPAGSFISASRTIAGSQDLEMTTDGQNTLDVNVSMQPTTTNLGEAGLGVNVKGVTKLISKGNMVQIEKTGFTKDTNAVFLGSYDKSTDGSETMDEAAQHQTNFSVSEGAGSLHDLVHGWKNNVVPTNVFTPEEQVDNQTAVDNN